jgi:hypothetical protein
MVVRSAGTLLETWVRMPSSRLVLLADPPRMLVQRLLAYMRVNGYERCKGYPVIHNANHYKSFLRAASKPCAVNGLTM